MFSASLDRGATTSIVGSRYRRHARAPPSRHQHSAAPSTLAQKEEVIIDAYEESLRPVSLVSFMVSSLTKAAFVDLLSYLDCTIACVQ